MTVGLEVHADIELLGCMMKVLHSSFSTPQDHLQYVTRKCVNLILYVFFFFFKKQKDLTSGFFHLHRVFQIVC